MSQTSEKSSSKWARIPKLLAGAAKFLPEAPWVAIVLELVSHLTASMGATSTDSKEALKHIESLHAELTQVTASHIALGSRLSEQTATLTTQSAAIAAQSKKLDALTDEVQLAHRTADTLHTRLEKLERRIGMLATIGIVLLVVVCVLTIVLLVHIRA
jgi:septal ring factor EnvC (AmiA/AmiB activator)